MEINTRNQVQGLENASKASEVKRENEEASGHQATWTEDNPDYRISLSNASKKAVAESTRSQATRQAGSNTDLSAEQALQVAQQTSEKLAQTNSAISNQAIQKAVDLFT